MSVQIDAVDIKIGATGAETTLAQLVAVRTEMQAMQGQTAALKVDTSGVKTAASDVKNLGTAHQGLGKTATTLKMDLSQVESARTSVKNLDNDLLSLATTAGKVGPALAAGVAAGALTKFASDYQTLLVTTSNQTNMTTGDIKTMDQTIRALPSGSAPLASLASGFKNITDLGYSAADAQKMATEESKAATAAGADQATTMLAITSAMKEYNATADEVAKYSNIVTEAARLGNTTLSAWTEGTRTGVAVAAAYGVSLQEADAFMVALTRHGFDATESATQLRGVIRHIVNETPNTLKEIAAIKAQTGIDLSPDFGPDAIKTQGFTKIMSDMQEVVAKTGDDSVITKLIPALRGGQGALITITQAWKDYADAYQQVGDAGSGKLDVVAQGFDRIQQTAGYQFSQTMKQVKFDLIDVGQAGLPAATALAEGFGKIPEPVIKAGVELGLFGLAVKSASVAGDLLTATWAKLTTSAAAETASTTAAADGTTTLTAALAANTEATLANTAAITGEVAVVDTETASLGAQTAVVDADSASWLANAAARAKAVAVPVALTLLGTHIAGSLGINDAMDGRAAGNARGTLPLEQQLATQSAFIQTATPDQIRANADILTANAKQILDQAQKQIDDYDKTNTHKALNVFDMATGLHADAHQTELQTQLDDAKRQFANVQTALKNSAPGGDANSDPFGLIAGTQPSDAEIQAMTDHYDLLATKRDELLAKGAPEALVNHALYPDDFGESKTQLAQYTKDLALWQQQYDATKSAATAAVTELGKVDVSKGIASLAASATGLEKVRAGLTAVGQSDDALDALTGIASRFDDIAKATDAASASYDGYTALLTNTNSYETKLDNYKKELDSAVAAAQAAVANGTATPDQVELLKDAPNIYGNIAQSLAQLDAHKAGDVLSIAKDMPDWVKADSLTRTTADNLGGIKAVDISVSTEKDAATTALEDLVNNPHVVTVHVQTVNDGGASAPFVPPANPNGKPDDYAGTAPSVYGREGSKQPPAGYGATISYDDYQKVLANYPGSPIANQGAFNDLTSVSQQMGVDPRTLMAIMQTESQYGTNAGLIGQQFNYGGMGVNDRGFGHDSGVHAPEAGGPEYEGYDDFKSFLMDISAWVKQNGTSFSNYQTADGGQAKNATMAQLDAALPLTGGGAGPDMGAATNAAFSVGNAVGNLPQPKSVSGDAIVAAAKQHINEISQIDGEPWYMWCEKFVDDQVQQVTGSTYRPKTAAQHVADAQNGVAGAGTVIDAAHARAGDLVGFAASDAPGMSEGHIGIDEGNGNYIGTTSAGIQERPIPAGAVFIRPDGVVAAGPEPGATVYKAPTSSSSSQPAIGYGPGTYSSTGGTSAVGDKNYTQPPDSAYAPKNLDSYQNQTNVLAGLLQDLGGKGAAQLNNYFDQIFAAETKKITDQTKGVNADGSLNADQKKTIDNQALAQSLDLTNAVGRAMLDVDQHSANYAADLQKVRDSGGAIGANLAQQVDLYRQIGEANDKITADQTAITNLDAANTARKQQESADDQAASRAKTRDGWATAENDAQIARYQQGIQAGWQQEQVVLTAKQTAADRSYQDATTAEDRSHTLKMRNLDDQLKSMQKLQTTADSGNSQTEQNLSLAASGPGDLGTKLQSGELLSIQKDFDSRNRQTLTDQIAAITDAQVAENRLYEDDKYNRDLAHTTATRNFQDEATQAANNHTKVTDEWASEAFQRAEMARQQTITDTEAQWQLQDLRAKKDDQYTTDKAAADATLKSDQDHAKALTDQATATSDALKTWGKIADLVGSAGNGLLSVLPALAALAGSGGGLSPADTNQIISIVNGAVAKNSRRLGGSDGVARGAA